MSNSPLVVHKKISAFKSTPRSKTITKITPHHVAGNLTIESIGQVFQTPGRNASSNYGIGSDGRVGMYVEEKDRSWCSSSAANDNAALTIEVANNSGSPNWTVSPSAWEALVKLCVDMCQRNPGIKQKDGRPGIYCDDTPNASLTFHRYFSATGCAQPYIWNRRQQLCEEVNKRLGAPINKPSEVLYRVQTGAFGNKANADAMLAKVKAAGFDTYMVKVDNLYKIQVGAYSKKPNADAVAAKLKAAGFETYITTESGTAVSSSSKKSVDEIAREVIQGLWGNGQDRKNRLAKAGYDYSAVQKRVAELL